MTQDIWAVILAAGQGTRMKSELLKVLHPVAGRPMVDHVLRAARGAGITDYLVVVGYQAEKVKDALGGGVEYVLQLDQKGTGHALMQCEPSLSGKTGDLLVLYGDNPLLDARTISDLVVTHRETEADATALTAIMPDPVGLGRIIRDASGRYLRTVEEKDASPEQLRIKESMSGIFIFKMPLVFDLLRNLKPNNAQGEFYLVDVLGKLVEMGRPVSVSIASDYRTVIGPNTRQGLAQAEAIMRERVMERLMNEGVTIIDPNSTYIHDTVAVGRDTVIRPFSFVEGNTVIGERCQIGPSARIIDSVVGDGVTVDLSVVEESRVESGARIGPFSHLRPKSIIGERVEIGNYAEIKNTVVGAGAKAHHHCYLGDATIGQGANIGAGVVVVNYNGVNKNRTEIGERAFVGCNANLIAPIEVGDDAYVAAGSTVNQDVPPGSLAIARAKQANKEGYVERLRAQLVRQAGKKKPKEK